LRRSGILGAMTAILPTEFKSKKLVVFDLDGTLTISKSPLDEEMAELLKKLLVLKKVAVISGGFLPQHQKQIIPFMGEDEAVLSQLFLFPASSTVFVRYEDGEWKKVYENIMSEKEKAKIMNAFNMVFEELSYQKPEKLYGVDIEDRGTQVSFSPLGQQAPVELKVKWNAEHNDFRKQMRDRLTELLPEFEVRVGGLTTIDITPKGIDKAYGIRKIEEHLNIPISDMVFIGDEMGEGGNDGAVKVTGIDTIEVEDQEETKKIIRELIK